MDGVYQSVLEQDLHMNLMHVQWFSDKSSFVPKKTFGTVRKHFLLVTSGKDRVLQASRDIYYNAQDSLHPIPTKY